jgi:transketolase
MRAVLAELLEDLLNSDPSAILLTGDLGYGVLDHISETRPQQFLNVGVAEQNMIGVAAGLSLVGHRILCYSIANFITLRCLEQIRNDVIYHDLDVTLIAIGAGCSYGSLGFTHFAIEDLACTRVLPGLSIFCPATDGELRTAFPKMMRSQGPKYLRVDRASATIATKNVQWGFENWTELTDGEDVTIFSLGSILEETMVAAEILEGYGISIRIVSAGLIKPASKEMIRSHATGKRCIAVVEEHMSSGGLAGIVAEAISETGGFPPLLSFGLNDQYPAFVGDQKFLRRSLGLDAESIARKILGFIVPPR